MTRSTNSYRRLHRERPTDLAGQDEYMSIEFPEPPIVVRDAKPGIGQCLEADET